MKIIKKYESFNERRYGNPWVAIVDKRTAKPNFTCRVGGYTGGYGKGEAGALYVTDPQDRSPRRFCVYVRSKRSSREQHRALLCAV